MISYLPLWAMVVIVSAIPAAFETNCTWNGGVQSVNGNVTKYESITNPGVLNTYHKQSQ